ncbi:MAG: quinone oxidoreductase family protein [Solirubrobacteraceae bacterium]
MSTTRAVAIPEPGGPEVLRVIDRPVREPAAGEVRIRVRFAAVNPTDVSTRTRGSTDVPPPWTPGMDAAGTVESVGEGVTELAVGQQVMAVTSPRRADGGAQAELIVIPAASAVPLPDGVSLQAAATLPMNGLTAILGLDMLGLSAGETLAVSGGAGLLASYVIPLAKQAGLTVIADARPDETELVRGYGADVVVERSEDFGAVVRAVQPDGVAAAFDTALLNERALGAIRDGGGLAVVRGWDGPAERGITVHKVFVFSVLERTDWLRTLAAMASDGRITLRPLETFPPERVAEAQQRMDAGGLRGRLLIAF